jgi:transcriptional regulator with XRE-family HTH domain
MSNQNIEKRELPEWRKRAQFRKENSVWLKFSGKIALRMLAALEDIPDMNQKRLAELADVSPQHISKVLKGEENLTLKSIARFSEILGKDLIEFPSYKYHEKAYFSVTFVAVQVDINLTISTQENVNFFDVGENWLIHKSVSSEDNTIQYISI